MGCGCSRPGGSEYRHNHNGRMSSFTLKSHGAWLLQPDSASNPYVEDRKHKHHRLSSKSASSFIFSPSKASGETRSTGSEASFDRPLIVGRILDAIERCRHRDVRAVQVTGPILVGKTAMVQAAVAHIIAAENSRGSAHRECTGEECSHTSTAENDTLWVYVGAKSANAVLQEIVHMVVCRSPLTEDMSTEQVKEALHRLDRALIVLDDVREQSVALKLLTWLPRQSRVVITSRSRFEIDGAATIVIGILTRDEAVEAARQMVTAVSPTLAQYLDFQDIARKCLGHLHILNRVCRNYAIDSTNIQTPIEAARITKLLHTNVEKEWKHLFKCWKKQVLQLLSIEVQSAIRDLALFHEHSRIPRALLVGTLQWRDVDRVCAVLRAHHFLSQNEELAQSNVFMLCNARLTLRLAQHAIEERHRTGGLNWTRRRHQKILSDTITSSTPSLREYSYAEWFHHARELGVGGELVMQRLVLDQDWVEGAIRRFGVKSLVSGLRACTSVVKFSESMIRRLSFIERNATVLDRELVSPGDSSAGGALRPNVRRVWENAKQGRFSTEGSVDSESVIDSELETCFAMENSWGTNNEVPEHRQIRNYIPTDLKSWLKNLQNHVITLDEIVDIAVSVLPCVSSLTRERVREILANHIILNGDADGTDLVPDGSLMMWLRGSFLRTDIKTLKEFLLQHPNKFASKNEPGCLLCAGTGLFPPVGAPDPRLVRLAAKSKFRRDLIQRILKELDDDVLSKTAAALLLYPHYRVSDELLASIAWHPSLRARYSITVIPGTRNFENIIMVLAERHGIPADYGREIEHMCTFLASADREPPLPMLLILPNVENPDIVKQLQRRLPGSTLLLVSSSARLDTAAKGRFSKAWQLKPMPASGRIAVAALESFNVLESRSRSSWDGDTSREPSRWDLVRPIQTLQARIMNMAKKSKEWGDFECVELLATVQVIGSDAMLIRLLIEFMCRGGLSAISAPDFNPRRRELILRLFESAKIDSVLLQTIRAKTHGNEEDCSADALIVLWAYELRLCRQRHEPFQNAIGRFRKIVCGGLPQTALSAKMLQALLWILIRRDPLTALHKFQSNTTILGQDIENPQLWQVTLGVLLHVKNAPRIYLLEELISLILVNESNGLALANQTNWIRWILAPEAFADRRLVKIYQSGQSVSEDKSARSQALRIHLLSQILSQAVFGSPTPKFEANLMKTIRRLHMMAQGDIILVRKVLAVLLRVLQSKPKVLWPLDAGKSSSWSNLLLLMRAVANFTLGSFSCNAANMDIAARFTNAFLLQNPFASRLPRAGRLMSRFGVAFDSKHCSADIDMIHTAYILLKSLPTEANVEQDSTISMRTFKEANDWASFFQDTVIMLILLESKQPYSENSPLSDNSNQLTAVNRRWSMGSQRMQRLFRKSLGFEHGSRRQTLCDGAKHVQWEESTGPKEQLVPSESQFELCALEMLQHFRSEDRRRELITRIAEANDMILDPVAIQNSKHIQIGLSMLLGDNDMTISMVLTSMLKELGSKTTRKKVINSIMLLQNTKSHRAAELAMLLLQAIGCLSRETNKSTPSYDNGDTEFTFEPHMSLLGLIDARVSIKNSPRAQDSQDTNRESDFVAMASFLEEVIGVGMPFQANVVLTWFIQCGRSESAQESMEVLKRWQKGELIEVVNDPVVAHSVQGSESLSRRQTVRFLSEARSRRLEELATSTRIGPNTLLRLTQMALRIRKDKKDNTCLGSV